MKGVQGAEPVHKPQMPSTVHRCLHGDDGNRGSGLECSGEVMFRAGVEEEVRLWEMCNMLLLTGTVGKFVSLEHQKNRLGGFGLCGWSITDFC